MAATTSRRPVPEPFPQPGDRHRTVAGSLVVEPLSGLLEWTLAVTSPGARRHLSNRDNCDRQRKEKPEDYERRKRQAY
jgi:hypothetical protein